MTEKEMVAETAENQQETVQTFEQIQNAGEQKSAEKEKTAEERALEQGYYACCFRSH